MTEADNVFTACKRAVLNLPGSCLTDGGYQLISNLLDRRLGGHVIFAKRTVCHHQVPSTMAQRSSRSPLPREPDAAEQPLPERQSFDRLLPRKTCAPARAGDGI